MSHDDTYVPGDWNAVCYVCGQDFKASQMRKHWKGYYVCPRDWESRHPQDFVTAPPATKEPPWIQPQILTNFVHFCTANGRTAIPGYAEPGCVIPEFIDFLFNPT